MKKRKNDCLIIGSGISGLTAAHYLKNGGLNVTIIDKGRNAGGRLATREIQDNGHPGAIDFGAQFFTIKSPVFQDFSRDWFQQQIVHEWFNQRPEPNQPESGKKFPRYCGNNGMRSITGYLAKNLEIFQSQKVTNIDFQEKWMVSTESGSIYHSPNLLITAPLPQTLELLPTGIVSLDGDILNELAGVRYSRCLTLMGVLEKPSHLTYPGAISPNDSRITWITDNQKKGISPELPTYTIHCTPEYSLSRWNAPKEQILSELTSAILKFLGVPLKTVHLHRWKYANPISVFSEPYLLITKPSPLILAGDGFTEGRVEGAALSGIAAAKALLSWLNG